MNKKDMQDIEKVLAELQTTLSSPVGEFPEVAVKIFELFTDGKKEEAKHLFYEHLPFIRLGNLPGGIAMYVHKEVLRMGGIFETSNVRGHFLHMDDLLKSLLDDCIKDLDLKALRRKENH